MTLIHKIFKPEKKDNLGSDAEHQHGGEFRLWKLVYLLAPFIFSIIVMIYNFGAIPDSNFTNVILNQWWGFSWATLTFILFYHDIFDPLIDFIKEKKANDVSFLLSIAITVSYLYSLVTMIMFMVDPLIFGSEITSFEQISMYEAIIEILFIVYIGYWINDTVNRKVKRNIVDTDSMFSKYAIKLVQGKEEKVKIEDLNIGDLVVVRNGNKFATDGEIVEGKTTVDEAFLTGESIPIEKNKGKSVYAGTISQGEKVVFKVTKKADDSMLAKIIGSINKTSEQKSKVATMIDKIEYYMVPFLLIVSLISLIVWSIILGPSTGFRVFATSLIVACPMVFVLLIPTTSLFSSAVAFKKGITFNSTNIFINSLKTKAIVFDKTGTLTKGELTFNSTNIDEKYLTIVKTLEDNSNHPIAKSINDKLKSYKKLDIKVKEIPGKGMIGIRGKDTYRFGSFKFINESGELKENIKALELKKEGSLISYLSKNNKVIGYIELKDEINPTSYEMVKELKSQGKDIYMLTGDSENSSKYVARQLGIDEKKVFFEVNPMEKHKVILSLKEEYGFVAFMGDGINDALALEQADIGISAFQGTDLANASSSISLNSHNNNLVPLSLTIARRGALTIRIGFLASIIWLIGIVIFTAFIFPTINSLLLIGPIFGALSMIFNDLLPIIISSNVFSLSRKKLKGE